MTDPISLTFLLLVLFEALPMAIVSLAINQKTRSMFVVFFSIVAIMLAVGTIINASIGLLYSYYYRNPFSWVALGLGCGAIVVSALSLITFFITLKIRNRRRILARKYEESAYKQEIRPQPKLESKPMTPCASSDTRYIEEIKQLKELLDCGAITQEEFEFKKRVILGMK